MKIITLNLNGIRSANRKGLYPWLKTQNADFVCLQELKAQEEDLSEDIKSPDDYLGYFSYAIKKGYSGVGIYCRHKPIKVTKYLDIPEIDDEGRFIELEFDKLIIISVYLPSGSSGDERQAFKYKVLDKINKIFEEKIKQEKNIIICGDFNIAHHEIDLKNYKGNKKNSGFLPEERAWLTNLFDNVGFNDVYRNLYPEQSDESYTWWSNRGQAWLKNVGWRIDYQVANPSLADKALSGNIYKESRFSDHAPLIINYSD
jgi:exodeoxyribonuclease III